MTQKQSEYLLKRGACIGPCKLYTLDARRCAVGQAPFNICFSVVSTCLKEDYFPGFLNSETSSCDLFCYLNHFDVCFCICQTEAPKNIDCNLPDITTVDIEALARTVPELKPQLR